MRLGGEPESSNFEDRTGQSGGGLGKKNARLVAVTFYPVVGDSVALSADSNGTLI